MRRFSTDKPDKSSQRQSAVVRARLDASNYLIDRGDGAETAVSLGNVLINRGQAVFAWWNPYASTWIIAAAVGESPLDPVSVQSSESLLIAGGGA